MKLAIVQARMSSTRLPGKVLEPLAGQPLLVRLIERVRQSRLLDQVVVATSTEASDDPIQQLCDEHDVACHRGPLDDVFARFLEVCRRFTPETVMRLTGDNPLVDPEVIDRVIEAHRDSGADYTSNSLERTFPYGLDVEAVQTTALVALGSYRLTRPEREHVTLGIRNRPARFRLESVRSEEDLSSLRFTVDYREDLTFVQEVFARLYPVDPAFRLSDVTSLLEREPWLRRTIDDVPR